MSTAAVSTDLLHFLAVGRLIKGPDGQFKDDYHQILSFQCNSNNNNAKIYRQHVEAIMSKGANKLQPGKRIRLAPDAQSYDLHVLPDAYNNDNNKILVFFAITNNEFDRHQSINNLLTELKQEFYKKFSSIEIENNSKHSEIQRYSVPIFTTLLTQYNNSKLNLVQSKVNEVKDIMKTNVNAALNNMEQLEDLELKSEQFEEQARQFNKGAGDVKRMMRCRYIKITIIIAVIVCGILAGVIAYFVDKEKKKG